MSKLAHSNTKLMEEIELKNGGMESVPESIAARCEAMTTGYCEIQCSLKGKYFNTNDKKSYCRQHAKKIVASI